MSIIQKNRNFRPPRTRATRLAHYYNWWGAWGHPIAESLYTPTQLTLLGSYDSVNMTMLDNHISKAIYGGLDGFIQDWWGQGQEGDIAGEVGQQINVFTEYLDYTQTNYPAFKWSLNYEDEGTGNPTVATIRADLQYLKANYFDHPQYLQSRDGRAVIFVYDSGGQDQDMVDRWQEAVYREYIANNPIFLILPLWANYKTATNPPPGWYSYAISGGADIDPPFSASLEPGVELFSEGAGPYTLARDYDRFVRDLRASVAVDLDYIVLKWNEFHEGTQVEPTDEEGEIYIDAMRDILGAV